MSKAVLISIKPEWCSLIAIGKKTVEVRKSIPKLDTPFKCYIYCTKSSKGWFFMDSPDVRRDGKVIGKFICNWLTGIKCDNAYHAAYNRRHDTCLSDGEIMKYANNGKLFYWHISELKIYDRPKELSEFNGLFATKFGYEPVKIKVPPQSWRYVEEREGDA